MISQSSLKRADGCSQQQVPGKVVANGASCRHGLAIAVVVGSSAARRPHRLGLHHLFGNRVRFPFVNIVGRAKRQFGLQARGCDEALNGTVPNRTVQREDWLDRRGKALEPRVRRGKPRLRGPAFAQRICGVELRLGNALGLGSDGIPPTSWSSLPAGVTLGLHQNAT
jgi:hypothetical protein